MRVDKNNARVMLIMYAQDGKHRTYWYVNVSAARSAIKRKNPAGYELWVKIGESEEWRQL